MTPSLEYRRLVHNIPPKPLKGLDARVNSVVGWFERRGGVLSKFQADAERIDTQACHWREMASASLHVRLMEIREVFRRGGQRATDLLPEAVAAIREAADRQVGLRPFPVQLMGALALHRGFLVEMATGEGKTLTAGLAAVLAGWTKQPTHIVTANDYLVARDAEWLQPLYHFCGVRVGTVTAASELSDRQKGYGCDVTYTTSKELLADFLRDRLRLGSLHHPTRRLIRHLLAPQAALRDGRVLRGLHTAIVDEADSVLIDEAVTPLIISATRPNGLFREAGSVVSRLIADLQPVVDYEVNPRYREIELTTEGRRKVQDRCAQLPGLWRGTDRRNELVRLALSAREFFHPGKQYIIDRGKVVIVDEFTGRPMPQRTWREGLHQAIEAKEGLAVSDPSETVARLSFQSFFRCFRSISGMTGTAREAAGEFWGIYRLPVLTIPTNRPCVREHWADQCYPTEKAKWQAITEEVVRMHGTGRPLLVGTRSVAASEKLAGLLAARQIDCRVLNAVQIHDEAKIIALAGERGRITIATNMAGRGTDIKLGQGVASIGGLHVLATERHESGRVDRQLFGRAARQGDLGSAQAFVSAEDELIRRHLPKPLQQSLIRAVTKTLPCGDRFAQFCFGLAQRNAQRLAYKQRGSVLQTDTWLDEALSFSGPT